MADVTPKLIATWDEAAEWFVRMRSEECTPEDRAHFEAWLAESEKHRHEYDKIARLFNEFEGLSGFPAEEVRRAFFRKTSTPPARHSIRRVGKPLALAASAALLAIGAWYGFQYYPETATYRTTRNQQLKITAPDSSVIHLNGDTVLSYSMSAKKRNIVLESGEAAFIVAHDESRPFTVRAGKASIVDIGTEFDVHRASGSVSVGVIEGSVEVKLDRTDHSEEDTRLLSKGESLSFDDVAGYSSVRTADAAAQGAWREGKIIANGIPVADVAAQFNRYYGNAIVIKDPALGNTRITGTFFIHDRNGFLNTMAQMLPAEVAKAESGDMIISGIDDNALIVPVLKK